MTSPVNPYSELLGLPQSNSRPTYYELLGIENGEDRERAVKAAYYQRVAQVSVLQSGTLADACKVLLVELAEARDCLTNAEQRHAYYQRLIRKPGYHRVAKSKQRGMRQRQPKSQVKELVRAHQSKSVSSSLFAPLTCQSELLSDVEPDASAGDHVSHVTESFVPKTFDDVTATPSSVTSSLSSARLTMKVCELDQELASTIVATTKKQTFFGRMTPWRTAQELVKDLFAKGNATDLQQRLLRDNKLESLVIGPYLIEAPLHRGRLQAIDSEMQLSNQDITSIHSGHSFLASRLSDGELVSLRVLPATFRDHLRSMRTWINRTNQINSPAAMKTFDCGFDQGRVFVATEYRVGEDLRSLVNRLGPLTLAQTMNVVLQCVQCLDEALRLEIQHPAFHPGKILIDPKGKLSVRHFALDNCVWANRMQRGNLKHIFAFLPPDNLQFVAAETCSKGLSTDNATYGNNSLHSTGIDCRANVYSLGCLMYYLLTGDAPMSGASASEIAKGQVERPLPRVTAQRSDIPAVVDQLIRRMTAKISDRRFDSYNHLQKALSEVCRIANLRKDDVQDSWSATALNTPIPIARRRGVRRLHLGRLIATTTLTVATLASLGYAGMQGYELILKWNTEESLAPAVTPRAEPNQPSQPREFQFNETGEVPKVESFDAFQLD
ncbi:hypothetical protein N9N28_08870 [Rubripirellula amarantea]|nr:hypothetical protein [Rubripirellula amarantea]